MYLCESGQPRLPVDPVFKICTIAGRSCNVCVTSQAISCCSKILHNCMLFSSLSTMAERKMNKAHRKPQVNNPRQPQPFFFFFFAKNQCEMLEKSSKELGTSEGSHPSKAPLFMNRTPPVPAACWVELIKHAQAEVAGRCSAFVSYFGKMELTMWRRSKWTEATDACVSFPRPLFLPFFLSFFSPSFIFHSSSSPSLVSSVSSYFFSIAYF